VTRGDLHINRSRIVAELAVGPVTRQKCRKDVVSSEILGEGIKLLEI